MHSYTIAPMKQCTILYVSYLLFVDLYTEDPDQPLIQAFEEKTNLHAANSSANDVDNKPAIVSCVGRIHPSLLEFMYEQLTFHAKKGAAIHL